MDYKTHRSYFTTFSLSEYDNNLVKFKMLQYLREFFDKGLFVVMLFLGTQKLTFMICVDGSCLCSFVFFVSFMLLSSTGHCLISVRHRCPVAPNIRSITEFNFGHTYWITYIV